MVEAPPIDYGELNALRQQLALMAREKALREANGLDFYRPHAKQDKFHLAAATGRYLRTGNRFGKSDAGMAETLSQALGGRIFYRNAFDILDGNRQVYRHHEGGMHHPFVTQGIPQRPIKALIITVNWDKANSIFLNYNGDDAWATNGKLFKMLPYEARGEIKKGRSGNIEKVYVKRPTEFGGGVSTISFNTVESYKHNPLNIESDDWDFIHVDEPCPEDMFIGLSRGLMDRDGSYIFTCTPLDEMWINDRFTPPKMRASDVRDVVSFERKTIICGSLYDNPYRNEKGVEEFVSGLDKDKLACRIHGVPLEMAGLIYKEFCYDEHVLDRVPLGWTDYENPPANYTIRVAWDVHQAIPQAVLLAATAPDGTVFFYDEIWDPILIGETATILKQKIMPYFIQDSLIDPFAIIRSPIDDTSILDTLLHDYDLDFVPASKDMKMGISATSQFLKERRQDGKPVCYFSPRLTQTLWEINRYVYKNGKPKDKDDHFMENLRRLVLNGLGYVPPPTQAQYRRKPTVVRFNEHHTPRTLLRA